MDIDKILQSKKFKIVMSIIGGLIVLFLVFGAGMFVGEKRADFSFRWAENYHRNFGGPREGFLGNMGNMMDRDFLEGHGVFGQIIKIDGSTLIINGRDNKEKIILIKDNTIINGPQNNLKPADLKVNDYVVIIGNPNDTGQIEAELIRFMPPIPAPMMNR